MNIKQREILHNMNNLVKVEDLHNKKDRTLLYGYDCDRATWHTYVKGGKITTVAYGGYDDIAINEIPVNYNREFIPNKRLYPECCDFEFCQLLVERGLHLPFAVFDEDRVNKRYYGKTL